MAQLAPDALGLREEKILRATGLVRGLTETRMGGQQLPTLLRMEQGNSDTRIIVHLGQALEKVGHDLRAMGVGIGQLLGKAHAHKGRNFPGRAFRTDGHGAG